MALNKIADFKVSIVVPCKNEASTIEYSYNEIVKSIESFNYELIFIDDGSNDITNSLLKNIEFQNENVKVITLAKNHGQQAAMYCGLSCAKGDCIIFLDADLQTPLFLIEKMISKWRDGAIGVFTTYTYSSEIGFIKRTFSFWFYRIFNLFSTSAFPQNLANYMLIDRSCKNVIIKHLLLKMNLFEYVKEKQILRFEINARKYGYSKYSFLKMLSLSVNCFLVLLQIPLLSKKILINKYLFNVNNKSPKLD